jgi:hypothetical protein
MRCSRRNGVLGLLVLACAISVLPVAPAAAGDLVLPPTPTEAERIVAAYNAKNAENNAALDLEGQATIEAPPIKTIDDAVFLEHRGRGATGLDDPFSVERVEVFVPEQSAYPLRFVARLELLSLADPEPIEQLLVFEQAAAGEPWKVTLAASLLAGADVPELAIDRHGLASIVTGSESPLQVSPTKLATKLTKLWQRSAEGAAISRPFAPGLLTTDAVALFVGELDQLPVNEATVEFTFRPMERQPLCFATQRDGALCFFAVTYEAVLDPVSGVFVQPPTRETLTGLVAPGEYGSVTFQRDAIVLAAVPKRTKLGRVDIVGFYNGLVGAQTSPPGVDAPSDAV